MIIQSNVGCGEQGRSYGMGLTTQLSIPVEVQKTWLAEALPEPA